MTLSLKHAFTTSKVDGGDPTLVKPSNWNAEHTLTCASNKVLGLDNSAPGAVIELPCTATGRALLASADVAAALAVLGISVPETGWVQPTFQSVATSTWVMMDDGTIGNAASNATTRHNADTAALFAMFWAISATYVSIFNSDGTPSTRGVDAATDYAANKRIALPKVLGRVLMAAGAGATLTARSLGQYLGEEGHALTSDENGPHIHTATQATHNHTFSTGRDDGANSGPNAGSGAPYLPGGTGTTANATPAITVQSSGLGTAHNNMQPSLALNFMVKL